MRFSYIWLKELTGIKESPEELAELLTFRSFEVEEVQSLLNLSDKIIIGEVKEIKKHPNADNLQYVKVNVGKEILDIVCGASNYKVGDKVPVALVGALVSGTEIKKAEIRGLKSGGMMCSEKELGLGDNHTGIMILPKDYKVGQTLISQIEPALADSILNISVLHNRQHDCLSHWGLAKEILAILGKSSEIKFDSGFKTDSKINIKNKLSVKVEDSVICPRYMAAYLEDVKIAPSPEWLRNKIIACGLKPINNVVDITNYVLFELGQPLHAFDFDKISGMEIRNSKSETRNIKNIIIRSAKQGEKIKAFDDNEYELSGGDIVIADNKKVIALGGMIGAVNSEIGEDTKTIVLESANFNYVNIRNTVRRTGLNTEAVARFGAGMDPNLAELGIKRAIYLIQKLAGAKVAKEIIDVYPKKSKSKKIDFDCQRANSLLGIDIPKKEIIKILNNLGFKIKDGKKIISVDIPTIRRDIINFSDLVEEVGRIYGYEKIKSKAPIGYFEAPRENEDFNFENLIKNLFIQAGYSDVQSYSFVSGRDLEVFGVDKEKCARLINPVSEEYAYLRPNLEINLLKSLKQNLKNFEQVRIFEIGKSFDGKFNEKKEICAVISGSGLDNKNEDFYEIKGVAEFLLRRIGLNDYEFINKDGFASIESSRQEIGKIKPVILPILEEYKISYRAFILELNYDKLRSLVIYDREYKELPKYPAIERDISVLAGFGATTEEIQNIIETSGGKFLEDSDLIDVYEPEDEGEKTSFTFSLIFRANDRTLAGKEVDELMAKIVGALKDAEFEIK